MKGEKEMKFNIQEDRLNLREALQILGKRYGFEIDEMGKVISFIESEGDTLEIQVTKDKACITYPNKSSLFRGIGHIAQKSQEGVEEFTLKEKVQFPFNGLMIDCSRNGVVNIRYAKEVIEMLAIMGNSVLMLYMEDVYEIEGEPYFGYLRGRYTKDELRELDAYALQFGVEIIPCIQTLAHLDQFLMWDQEREKYLDIDNILYVGKPEVQELLRKMIKHLSETFTSRRIHIGMDEAYQLGRGRYADEHGLEVKPEIMKKHLKYMIELTNEYGLRPIIWDDMFFSNYSRVDEKQFTILEGIDLMYWDYYNNTEEHYIENIEKRKTLNSGMMFAGGAWRWIGYTPHHSKTFVATNASLMACKKKGVKEVIATAWADDGCEAPVSTCLFGTTLFAEHGYNEEVDLEVFKKRLQFCTGLSYENYMKQEAFDILPEFSDPTTTVTPSKYMLYEDPLCSMFVYHTREIKTDLTEHYEKLYEYFKNVSEKEESKMYKAVGEFYAAYAKVLSLKWNLGMNLVDAYQNKNLMAMEEIKNNQLIPLIKYMENMRDKRFEEWQLSNKSLGFEVLDLRFGGMIQRLRTTIHVVEQYTKGEIDSILELEEERLPRTHFREAGMGEAVHFNGAQRSMTAGKMTW